MGWGEDHVPKPLSPEAQKAAVEMSEAIKAYEGHRSSRNEDALYTARDHFEGSR